MELDKGEDMEKVTKFIRAEIKEVNVDNFTLTATISTKKVDRDGDIIQPEAFSKRLKSYKDHPVLLSSHRYDDLRKQIGKAISVNIGEDEVTAKFEYIVGQGNQEADWAWVLAQKGLASYSIGFLGHEFEWLKDKDAEGNERITGRKFSDIELLEISQVLVPSNRGALQSGRALAQEELELCELVNKSLKDEDFQIEQKPKPKPDESRDDYMSRCIPQVIGEGKDRDQAVATCNSLWENRDKSIHYSDELLGKEGQVPISAPKGEIGIDDIKDAVGTAVSQIRK